MRKSGIFLSGSKQATVEEIELRHLESREMIVEEEINNKIYASVENSGI